MKPPLDAPASSARRPDGSSPIVEAAASCRRRLTKRGAGRRVVTGSGWSDHAGRALGHAGHDHPPRRSVGPPPARRLIHGGPVRRPVVGAPSEATEPLPGRRSWFRPFVILADPSGSARWRLRPDPPVRADRPRDGPTGGRRRRSPLLSTRPYRAPGQPRGAPSVSGLSPTTTSTGPWRSTITDAMGCGLPAISGLRPPRSPPPRPGAVAAAALTVGTGGREGGVAVGGQEPPGKRTASAAMPMRERSQILQRRPPRRRPRPGCGRVAGVWLRVRGPGESVALTPTEPPEPSWNRRYACAHCWSACRL